MSSFKRGLAIAASAIAGAALSSACFAQVDSATTIPLADLAKIGTVDDRYQSYNIEMIQVMGGKWWAPYTASALSVESSEGAKSPSSGDLSAAGMLYRPPTDLGDPRLRKLASALSPAYVRVTDTWANTVYFQDNDALQPASPPPGFGAVMTRRQWKGVIDFSNAVDAKIVTSFSIGAGVRDAQGVWAPGQAEALLSYTKHSGGSIAAAEFFNEPNLGVISGAPKGYDAQAYARDYSVFRRFIKQADPSVILLGPGAVGENKPLPGVSAGLDTDHILAVVGPDFDGVSYHFYGALSQRCSALGPTYQTTPQAALTTEWLMGTARMAAIYGDARDRFEPGKPVWLTETGESACGGNPWAANFIDSFRYLNQLGVLATQGVQVVMHNTLAGSDYGLIDDVTLTPRPNYWAAVLWRRLMGSTVLKVASSGQPNLYLYAQCLPGRPGGVTLMAINADATAPRAVRLRSASTRYTLTAQSLLGASVDLNGEVVRLSANGDLPALNGAPTRAGSVFLPPQSITFLAAPDAGNARCT